MASFTRGFTGRGRRRARRAPASRAVRHRRRLAGAQRRGHPDPRHRRRGPSPSTGLVERPDDVDVGRDPRAPSLDLRRRHPLRHDVVEVRHELRAGSRSTRCWRRPGRSRTPPYVMAHSHTGYTTNLPLADVTGGKAWVVWEVDGQPLPIAARRPGPAPGAPPLLLEERQVGGRTAAARPRRAGLLGAQRLPRPRRPLARAALPGRLTDGRHDRPTAPTPWRTARVVAITDETPRAKTFRLALPGPSAHRAGQHFVVRLTAPDGYTAVPVVLGGVGTGRHRRDRAHRRAARRRRGVGLPPRRRGAWATSSRSEARSVAGSSGRGASPALLVGGGSGLVPADVDAAPGPAHGPGRPGAPRRLGAHAGRPATTRRELPGPETTVVFTRAAPAGEARPPGRLTGRRPRRRPLDEPDATTYVCGSAGFADAASRLSSTSACRRAHPRRALRPQRLSGRRAAERLTPELGLEAVEQSSEAAVEAGGVAHAASTWAHASSRPRSAASASAPGTRRCRAGPRRSRPFVGVTRPRRCCAG